MKTYEHFAKRLDQLLGTDQCVRIHVEGYMPLVIEDIGFGDTKQIAISHTSVRNGDLMRDPEIVFERSECPQGTVHAEPISFRNDYAGTMQYVYSFDADGKRTGIRPRLKTDLRSFSRTWFRNLREQGFFTKAARREVLA